MTSFNSFSKVFLSAVLLLIFAQHYSCKNGGVTPPDEGCPPPTKLDSTSHNFIWRLDTLGDGDGSTLNDVVVINDTLGYAVGEMYLKDTTGQYDPLPYNLARWDGQKWTLQRVPYVFEGQTLYHPIQGIFAFNQNDIWFCGNGVIRWNGSQYVEVPVPSSVWGSDRMNKIWGTSSSSLWLVGNGGATAYYNGTSWQKLASPTAIDILDVFGGTNCKGEQEILAVASFKQAVPQAKKLLRIQGTTVSAVSDAGLPLALNSVWFKASQKYFVGGDGLFSNSSVGASWTEEQNIPPFYKESIRGVDLNNIFWAGGYGFISHYNGSSWHHYTGVEVPYIDGNYHSVSVHPRLVIAVGIVGQGRGITLVGRR